MVPKKRKATNAQLVRRQNVRSILAEIRKLGAASRPEIARRVALTPQAVNGIFEQLMDTGLIREGGKRGGSVGHPSTLYAVSPAGAYAIGIEIGPRHLEATLVNFDGQMVYRAVTDFMATDRAAIGSAASDGIDAVAAYMRNAGIDLDRIEGLGVIVPDLGVTDAGPCDESLFADALPDSIDIPVYVERIATVGALSMAMLSNAPLPDPFLYVAIGETVDSCLLIDGYVHRGAQARAGRLDALPVPVRDGGIATLGKTAGFAALRDRLAEADFRAANTEDLYRAQRDHSSIVEGWCGDAGDALIFGLRAVQACLDLGGVCLRIDPPVAVADKLVERIRKGFEQLREFGLAAPTLMFDHPPRRSLAVGAAIVALHERFAPKSEELRRRTADEAATPTSA